MASEGIHQGQPIAVAGRPLETLPLELEPATPLLEGRYLHFHRLEAANPFESSTSHRRTVYGRKHGSCQGFPELPAMACAQIASEEAM
jgi:hypothetical protein